MKYALISFLTFSLLINLPCNQIYSTDFGAPKITNERELVNLFPKNINSVKQLEQNALESLKIDIEKIINANPRTYENTVRAFDRAIANFGVSIKTMGILTYVAESSILEQAKLSLEALTKANLEYIELNEKLYNTLLDYSLDTCNQRLSESQSNYLKTTLNNYKNRGVGLDDQKRAKLKRIDAKIGKLCIDFEYNLFQDSSNKFIKFELEDLKGLSGDRINSFKRNGKHYLIGMDYATQDYILQNCEIELTRKIMWSEINQIGYPANVKILEKMVKLRHKKAKLLHYPTYAHLEIDDLMAKSPENVKKILDELYINLQSKLKDELNKLKQNLPESVELVDGKFKPWDLAYIITSYMKRYLTTNNAEVVEYFTLEHTLEQLFELYEKFFKIKFTKVNVTLWDEKVITYKAYKEDLFIGYLILDLFPRPGKFSHARCTSQVPAMEFSEDRLPAVTLVITNFNPVIKDNIACLEQEEVRIFFHECGHAIHNLLGATEFSSQSGTRVKRDFVEMPSQFLEYFLLDPIILKKITKHYKTGEAMPDELISKLVNNQFAFEAFRVMSELFSARFSLELFGDVVDDIFEKWKTVYHELYDYVIFDDNFKFLYSFWHLPWYGSRMYSYLYTQIIAAHIARYFELNGGFLNAKIADDYVSKIISPGGSKDPNSMLEDFLKTAPSSEAFFARFNII